MTARREREAPSAYPPSARSSGQSPGPSAAVTVPTLVATTGYSSRPVGLGLDAPLELRGGNRLDSDALAMALGYDWHHDLMSVIERECHRRAAAGPMWFALPPLLLVGPPGVGRTHVARRLAQAVGLPHALLDLAGPDASQQLRQAPRGTDLVLPSLPILAMAASRCANPVVSVTNVDRAAAGVQELLAAMIGSDSSARWREDSIGASVDLRHVVWMVQSDEPGTLVGPLRAALRRVDLEKPPEQRLHLLNLLVEAAADHGFQDLAGRLDVVSLIRRMGGGPQRGSTAEAFFIAEQALAHEFEGRP